jgi:GNAT superfamily N-acetyltransferase
VRGAGELHSTGCEGNTIAEVAFSVEEEFRNKGIGMAMLKRLIISARNRGFRHLRMNCHAQNLAMQALARKFKADLYIEQGGTVGDIIARPPTPFSLLAEVLGDAREIAKAAINLRQRR